MFELDNQSGSIAGIYAGWGWRREHQYTVVIKNVYKFDVTGKLKLDNDGSEIIQTDTYSGQPGKSSIEQAVETAPFKKGSEIIIYGTVYPPKETLKVMEVGVGILFSDKTEWKKVLRIFGERKWEKNILGFSASDAKYVKPTPLDYTQAFGGTNPENTEDEYELNPVGTGYNSDQRNLISESLPLIEIGPDFLSHPMQKPAPAGFGPVSSYWEPRVTENGEPDTESITQGVCPYAKTAKETMHNQAPLDQRFNNVFKGDEIIFIRGLVKDIEHKKTLKLAIPKQNFQIYTHVDSETRRLRSATDTVIINTEDMSLTVISRACIPWGVEDRKKGWVIIKDSNSEQIPYDKEGREAPRMASI